MAQPMRPQSAARAPQQEEQAPTHVVGPSMTHTGTTIHPGPVEIWGTIRGRLVATSVSVKPGGIVDGHIDANHVRNDGTIVGSVRTRLLELSRRSVTGGRIQAEDIGMERHARLREDTSMVTMEPGSVPYLSAEALARQAEEKSRQLRAGAGNVRALPQPQAAPVRPAVREERIVSAPSVPAPARSYVPEPLAVDDSSPRPRLVG